MRFGGRKRLEELKRTVNNIATRLCLCQRDGPAESDLDGGVFWRGCMRTTADSIGAVKHGGNGK